MLSSRSGKEGLMRNSHSGRKYHAAIFNAAIAILFFVPPVFADSLRFFEKYTDWGCYEYEGKTYCDQQDTWGKMRLSGFVPWDTNINLARLSSNALFYVGLGWPDSGSWSEWFGYFEDDPKYRPGKRSLSWPIGYWDDWEETEYVRSGTLKLRWNDKGLWFFFGGRTDTWDSAIDPALPPDLPEGTGEFTNVVQVQIVLADEWSDDQWWWERNIPVEIDGQIVRKTIEWDGDTYEPMWLTMKGRTLAESNPRPPAASRRKGR